MKELTKEDFEKFTEWADYMRSLFLDCTYYIDYTTLCIVFFQGDVIVAKANHHQLQAK
jgi:hypothetical protein